MEINKSPEAYQPEPADILRRKTIEFLKSKYPTASETQLVGLVGSLMYDMLSENKVSGLLERFSPDEQEKALLSVGARTVDEAIDKILSKLPEPILEFHMKKLGVKREFDL